MKCCAKCKESFESSYFGNSKHSTDGLYHWCKRCVSVDNKKRCKLTAKGLNWKQSLYDNGEKYHSKCDTVKKFSEFNKSKKSVSGFGSIRIGETIKKSIRLHKHCGKETPLVKLRFTLRDLILQALKKGGYTCWVLSSK